MWITVGDVARQEHTADAEQQLSTIRESHKFPGVCRQHAVPLLTLDGAMRCITYNTVVDTYVLHITPFTGDVMSTPLSRDAAVQMIVWDQITTEMLILAAE